MTDDDDVSAANQRYLDSLSPAPRYVIVRERSWKPALAVIPCLDYRSAALEAEHARLAGMFVQVVPERPTLADLKPVAGSPWPLRLGCLVYLLAVFALIYFGSGGHL